MRHCGHNVSSACFEVEYGPRNGCDDNVSTVREYGKGVTYGSDRPRVKPCFVLATASIGSGMDTACPFGFGNCCFPWVEGLKGPMKKRGVWYPTPHFDVGVDLLSPKKVCSINVSGNIKSHFGNSTIVIFEVYSLRRAASDVVSREFLQDSILDDVS